MNKNLRTAALSTLAGGALTVLGLLLGPAGSASAATVDIHLDATTGTATLPAKTGHHLGDRLGLLPAHRLGHAVRRRHRARRSDPDGRRRGRR